MSEKFVVPVQGSTVVSSEPAEQSGARDSFENGIYQPNERSRAESTRHFRMNGLGRQMARSMERRAQAEASAPTPAPAPQEVSQPGPSADYTAMQQELAALKQQVANFAQNPYGDQQYGQDDQLYPNPELDPASYDHYDGIQRLQYRNALDAHVKEMAQKAVEADRATRQREAAFDEVGKQCRAVFAKYGRDANYDEAANAAKLIHFNAGGQLSVEEAYLQASREIEARSGRRRSSYMPKEVKGLGAIIDYNVRTGRAGSKGRR